MAKTYEDISKANNTIVTMTLKTKDGAKEYAEVNQRIKAFRMVYPDGFIMTDMKSNQNGVCVFTAIVGYYSEDYEKIVLGTGTAYEKEGAGFVNKTSYIENCETSAVGRALGMAGFGIDTSVASYEEVANARLNQDKPVNKPAAKTSAKSPLYMDEEKYQDIVELAEEIGWDEKTLQANIRKKFKKDAMDLDVDEYTKIVNGLTGAVKDGEKEETSKSE